MPARREEGIWPEPDFAQIRVHGDTSTESAGPLAAKPVAVPPAHAAPDGVLQRCGAAPCLACSQEDDLPLMRQRTYGSAGPSSLPPIVREVLPSSGRPLEPGVRAFFEPRFGRDFGSVRVHTDGQAARAAEAIDAAAFTVGSSIWFGRGMYQPAMTFGRRLLAHELAHTIQQRGRPAAQRSLRLGAAGDAAEVAADRVADAVLAGEPVPSIGSGGLVIRRAPKVSPVPNDPSRRIVEMDDGNKYRVRRIVDLHHETVKTKGEKAWSGPTPRIDKNNVWLQVDVCTRSSRGDVKTEVKFGLDLPAAAQTVLKDLGESIKDGTDPRAALRKLDLHPFASVNITQSRRFTAGISGGPTVEPGAEKVTGGGLKATAKVGDFEFSAEAKIGEPPAGSGRTGPDFSGNVGIKYTPGSTPVKEVVCERTFVFPKISYQCEKIVPAHEKSTEVPVTNRQTHYFYFEYARPEFAKRGRTATLDAQGKADLKKALDAGYRIENIRGYASPEGPVDPVKGFRGNVPLSEDRAKAAEEWVKGICPSALSMRRPSCFAENYRRSGGGELYGKGPEGAELKGKELAEASVRSFESEPAEEPRRTRDVEEELEKKKTPERQTDTVWPLLRRAEIDMSKPGTEIRKETVPESAIPLEECSADVLRAVADDFDREPAVKQ